MASYPGGIMQYAIDEISNAYKAVDNNVGIDQFGYDRPCIIAETGWLTAHDGAYNGLAEPSEANSRDYWDRVQSWARSKRIGLFWFNSYDEPWKPDENGMSAKHWGIYTKDGNIKASFVNIKDAYVVDVGISIIGSGLGWEYSSGIYTITGNTIVKGSTGTPTNGNRIVINGGTAGTPLRITLQNVTINAIAPITISAGSHVVLTLNGNSVLNSTNTSNAGIQTTNAFLTIEAGTGSASLNVTGGSNAAGIGGGLGASGGTVIVNGGAVTVTSTNGAGIGGGRGADGAVGTTSVGGSGSAGGNGGNFTVNGGSVTATSTHGAGIGGGSGGNGGTGGLNVRDGQAGGAGGKGGTGSNTTVNGGSITAKSTYGAGIGGGSGGAGGAGREGSGNSGLGATGGRGGDGGAGGDGGSGGGLTISGGTITVRSDNAMGIGGGTGNSGGGGARGGQGGTGGGSGQGGKPGASGSAGGMGSISVSVIYNYTWWANTVNSDPGGLGTSYQNETRFSNNDTYKYVKIEMSSNLWEPWEMDRLDLRYTMPGMGDSWTYNGGVFTVAGDVMITGSTSISPSNGNRVVLSGGTSDKPLRITLQNVTIHASAPIILNPGTHAIIILNGSSVLTATNASSAGIRTSDAFLTIEAGTGAAMLDVKGGDDAAGIGGDRGTDGNSSNGGAGGGNSNITINGGTITATSINGAGIGGGRGGDGSYISTGGGTGGVGGTGGAVTINGGSVTATSTNGAGIGGGQGGLGGASGRVNQGRDGGIGGAGGSGTAVRINGGSVMTTSTNGAGIGGGGGNTGGRGGDGGGASDLWNNGYGGGAGGTGGAGGSGGNLTIDGGTVTARSSNSMSIGGGHGGAGGSGGNGGSGGSLGGSKGRNGDPGATGATGGSGTSTVSQIFTYVWWANTVTSDPGGPGTLVPGGAAFNNSATYKYVKIETQSFIPVTDITGIPTTAIAGIPLTLSGMVTPSNASNQTIFWSVSNAGGTGASVVNNIFTAMTEGSATVRATIPNGASQGSNFTRDFVITVQALELVPIINLSDPGTFLFGDGWTYSRYTGVYNVTGNVTILGSNADTGSRVVVAPGSNVSVTLDGASIDRRGIAEAFEGAYSCAFDMTGATVNLILTGDNTLISGNGRAGIEMMGNATLTISGDGSLVVMGGSNCAAIGSVWIESGTGSNESSVTISSGNITAIGGSSAAGIGGAGGSGFGDIVINGGIVTASSLYNGAGIGGGAGTSGTVTINGGEISAQGGQNAAGIGGGFFGSGGIITINGGTVTAVGGDSGAGIGGGTYGMGGIININGGDISATGSYGSAGIGSGNSASGGDITITGGTVTARGYKTALDGTVSVILPAYTYWVNTSDSDPGGPGTSYPDGPMFVNNDAYKFVRIMNDNNNTEAPFSVNVDSVLDSTTKFNGQSSLVTSFNLRANEDELVIQNTQGLRLAYDISVLQLIRWDAASAIDAPIAGNPFISASRAGNPGVLGDSVSVFTAMSLSGDTGYLSMSISAPLDTYSCPKGSFVTLGEVRFAFRPGKTSADLNDNSIRIMNTEELTDLSQSYAVIINDVHGNSYTYGRQENGIALPESDTLDKPEITMNLTSGVFITGKVKSYNPKVPTTVQLMRDNIEMYTTTIGAATGSDQSEQTFTLEGVVPGTYTLVINKPAHTSFTVQTIVVEDENVDLTQDIRPEVRLMTLRCGDINGDGMINDGDLTALWMIANYNRNTSVASNHLCDLNGDGMINDGDLTILWMIVNYNRSRIIIS